MENDPTTIFLYTQNFEKNLKNQDKLVKLSKQENVPVPAYNANCKATRTKVNEDHEYSNVISPRLE